MRCMRHPDQNLEVFYPQDTSDDHPVKVVPCPQCLEDARSRGVDEGISAAEEEARTTEPRSLWGTILALREALREERNKTEEEHNRAYQLGYRNGLEYAEDPTHNISDEQILEAAYTRGVKDGMRCRGEDVE